MSPSKVELMSLDYPPTPLAEGSWPPVTGPEGDGGAGGLGAAPAEDGESLAAYVYQRLQ
jgi:hypothetical protein